MGCATSKPTGSRPRKAGCCSCCGCCACCVAQPPKAVLYDDDDDDDLPAGPPAAAILAADKDMCSTPPSVPSSSEVTAFLSTLPCLGGHQAAGTAMGTMHATADARGGPQQHSIPASATNTPAHSLYCMPANIPNIPGLGFCLSVGMTARSLRALRSHLKAKGFTVDPQSEHTQPSPGHPGVGPTASHTEPLARSSSWSWVAGMRDANSHYPSSWEDGDAGMEDIPADCEDALMDALTNPVGPSETQPGTADDAASESSHTTFLSAMSPHRHPRHHTADTPLTLDHHHHHHLGPTVRRHRSAPHSHVQVPSSSAWEASVHQAQACVAEDDLTHAAPGSTHPALAAFQAGTLGWAFSGGGFFFPYHLGCVIQLKDMGIIRDTTPLAGASCGSIITACVNAGLDLHQLVFRLLEFAADCRTYGTAGRLRGVIEKFMSANLPEDAHTRCDNKTFISLTKVFPYLRPVVISEYHNKEDLVQAIATSCHIPAYNDGAFLSRFRGQYFVDGGLTRHIPRLPEDSGVTHVAGVSCVPFKFLEALPGVARLQLLHSLEVSPDMYGTFPFGWHEVGGLILAPAEDEVLLQMVEMGKQDILAWSHAVGVAQHISGANIVPRPVPTSPPPTSSSAAAPPPASATPTAPAAMPGTAAAAAAMEGVGESGVTIAHLGHPGSQGPLSPPGLATVSAPAQAVHMHAHVQQHDTSGVQLEGLDQQQGSNGGVASSWGVGGGGGHTSTVVASSQGEATSQLQQGAAGDAADQAAVSAHVGSVGCVTSALVEEVDWHDALDVEAAAALAPDLPLAIQELLGGVVDVSSSKNSTGAAAQGLLLGDVAGAQSTSASAHNGHNGHVPDAAVLSVEALDATATALRCAGLGQPGGVGPHVMSHLPVARQLPVLQLVGATCRTSHVSHDMVSRDARGSGRSDGTDGHTCDVGKSHVEEPASAAWKPSRLRTTTHADGSQSNNAQQHNDLAATAAVSHGDAARDAVHAVQPADTMYCLDLDVPLEASGVLGAAGVVAGLSAAGEHVVQLTTCIDNRPVLLNLKLHLCSTAPPPAAAAAAAAGTTVSNA